MKRVALFIILLLIINPVLAVSFNTKSNKILVVNLNEDKILYEENMNIKTEIASITKIVTAITVLNNTTDLNREVVITKEMISNLDDYTRVYLKVWDKVPYIDLLYSLLLPSAADSAKALAIDMSGSIPKFVELMNKEIDKIGVKNTHFSNPIGIDDEENYSTAYDLYMILKYCLKNDTFKKIFETNEYYMKSLNKTIYKTIYMISKKENIDISIIKGAKTGYTFDAGLCLISTANLNGVNYMIVRLNAQVDKSYLNINDSIRLYNYYNDNYQYKTIINKDDLILTLPVERAFTRELKFYIEEDINRYVRKNINKEDLVIEYIGINAINKDIKLNQKLGTISVIYDNELLYKKDIYLNKRIFYYNFAQILVLFVICVIIIIKIFNYKRDYKVN